MRNRVCLTCGDIIKHNDITRYCDDYCIPEDIKALDNKEELSVVDTIINRAIALQDKEDEAFKFRKTKMKKKVGRRG